MATSFAAYASQYLNRQAAASSTASTSQPMFFSFTTDGDGSRHVHNNPDLDDQDDPHLIEMSASAHRPSSPPQAGWLAHLTHSPRRSTESSSSESDSTPPADLLAPPPPPQTLSVSLTESLLPRDGHTRPLDVFTLPDPRHTPRKRRKHHDAPWISLWLALVTVCLFFCILLLVTTKRPPNIPAVMLPYTVLLRTVPMLVILTFLSAGVAYLHVYLLRVFVKPVMIATSVFIPATLFISAVWAFVGSFMWEADTVPTWGETVGLRLFSIVPLVLSIVTARRLVHLPRQIHATSSTLTLATHLLIANPFLLALSPSILLATLIGSIPFVTMIFRLLLVGYATQQSSSTWEWHVRAWANWSIAGTACVWFWSWAVARGVLRMSAASVIGAWYFANPNQPTPPPTDTHTIHAALVRSTGPSLGTVVLSGLILTALRILTLLVLLLRRLPPLLLRIPWVPVAAPIAVYVVPGIHWSVGWLEERSGRLSRYALVYAGLTGRGFWESAYRGRELTGGVESAGVVVEDELEEEEEETGRFLRRGKAKANPQHKLRKRKFGSEPPLALLTISPLTLSFPFALLTYLFVAHTLGAPHEALGAAILAGATTSLVGLFCVGVVRDTADTLYLCYCIDKAAGEKRREEVFIAFEYDFAAAPANARRNNNNGAGSSILPTHRPTGQGRGRKGERVLFDAVQEESEADSEEEGGGHPYQLPSRPSKQQQRRQQEHQQMSPFLDEPAPSTTVSARTQIKAKSGKQRAPEPDSEDEEEDLDPFQDHDEEARIGTARVATRALPQVSPTAAAAAAAAGTRFAQPGHARTPSGGVARNSRGLTATQELNMKSQFLMNLGQSQSQSQSQTPPSSSSRLQSRYESRHYDASRGEMHYGSGGENGGESDEDGDRLVDPEELDEGLGSVVEALRSQAQLGHGRSSGSGMNSGAGSGVGVNSGMGTSGLTSGMGSGSRSRHMDGEESLSEGEDGAGEESQLGPGSDFFN